MMFLTTLPFYFILFIYFIYFIFFVCVKWSVYVLTISVVVIISDEVFNKPDPLFLFISFCMCKMSCLVFYLVISDDVFNNPELLIIYFIYLFIYFFFFCKMICLSFKLFQMMFFLKNEGKYPMKRPLKSV